MVTAIGGGGTAPVTTARMYSRPDISAPSAAVASGFCQTRVRLRELRIGGGEGPGELRRRPCRSGDDAVGAHLISILRTIVGDCERRCAAG